MNLKTTLVLLAVVAGGAAVWLLGPALPSWFGLTPAAPDAVGAGTLEVLGEKITHDELTWIKIEPRGGDAVVLERGADYRWTAPGQWPTRKPEIEALLNLLSGPGRTYQYVLAAQMVAAPATRNLASEITEPVIVQSSREAFVLRPGLRSRFVPLPLSDEGALKDYGLDAPDVVVTVKAGPTDYRLAFAEKESPKEPSNRLARPTYLRLDKRPEVVRLAPGLVAALNRPIDYYLQRRLFPFVERVAKGGDGPDKDEKVEQLVAEALAVEEKKTSEGKKPAEEKKPLEEKKAGGINYALARKGGEWQLSQPARDRVDAERVKTILRAVPDVWAEQFVARPEKDLAKYGLKEPAQTVRVTAPNAKKPIVLLIGSEQPAKDGGPAPPDVEALRYAKLEDNDQVFLVKADRLRDLLVPAGDLRDPRLAHFKPEDARRLEVKYAGRDVVLVKDKDAWQLERPGKTPVDAEAIKVTDLLNELSGLEARGADVIDTADVKAYGFDDPAKVGRLTVTVEEEKGEGEAKKKENRTLSFSLGKHEKDKKKLYVRADGWPRVNAVADRLATLAERPALAYRNRRVLNFVIGDLDRIEVRRGTETVVLKQDKGRWKLPGPPEGDADPIKAGTLAGGLGVLEAAEYVKDDPDAKDLDGYGLTKDALAVKLVFDKEGKKEEQTLLIGKPLPPDKPDQFYARLESGKNVFAVTKGLRESLAVGPLDLLDRHLLTLDPNAVKRVESEGGAAPLTLERKGEAWQVTANPPAAPPSAADAEAMSGLLSVLSRLDAAGFAAFGLKPVDLEKYGLDKGATKVTITVQPPAGADGKEPPPRVHTLLLGKGAEGGTGERYARLDGGNGVARLPAGAATTLARGYLDYVDHSLLTFDAALLTGLKRQAGADALEVVKKESWQIIKPVDQKADAEGMQQLAAQLAGLRAVRVAAYPARDLKPFGLDAAAAVVTLQLGGDKPGQRVLKIGKAVEGNGPAPDHFAQAEGSAVVAVIPGPLADKLLAAPVRFRDRAVVQFKDADKVFLERGRRKATFANVEGTWKLTEPLPADAEHTALDEFANAVADLKAAELVAEKPADLKPYGLDKPQAHWRFLSGTKEVLNLLVGASDRTGKRCYAKLAAGDVVFLLDEKTTSAALAEYRTRAVWAGLLDAAQVQGVRFGYARSPFTLGKVGPLWRVAGKPDVLVNERAVNDALDALARLRVERYVVDKDADPKLYGLDPPELVIEVQSPAGKQAVEIGRTEGESKRYYARVPNKDRSDVFVISEADGARIVRDLAAFTVKPPKPEKP